MKNNKGFTLIELLVSFTLSMILVMILFQLIINLKELYKTSGTTTDIINKQNIMTNKIYTDLTEKKLINASTCGLNCIDFSYSTGETKRLSADIENQILKYDDYAMKLNNEYSLGAFNVETTGNIYSQNQKAIISIKIPIINKSNNNENLEIKIIYPYIVNEITNLTVENTYITDGLITYLDAINNTGSGHSNSTTTWKDLTENSYNATLYNNPTWTENSIIFNGTNNYALLNNTKNKSYNPEFTMEIRVKPVSFIGSQTTMEFFGNWEGAGGGFSYNKSGKYIAMYYLNGYKTISPTKTFDINTYVTMAVTYNSNQTKVYINGILLGTLDYNNINLKVSPVALGIGGNPGTNGMGNYANIEVQNVLIYDRALTANEVMQNYLTDQEKYK